MTVSILGFLSRGREVTEGRLLAGCDVASIIEVYAIGYMRFGIFGEQNTQAVRTSSDLSCLSKFGVQMPLARLQAWISLTVSI
jgi:hypothetical protein